MNKKIKIIDLLNKIANEEEIPQKIRFENKIYKYYKGRQDYIFYTDEDEFCGETLLFNIMSFHFISELLETEVEILEDNTEEIEELKFELQADNFSALQLKYFFDMNKKVDEIRKAVNELRKETK